MSKIFVMKLTTGEEIIAAENLIPQTYDNPRTLMMHPENGNAALIPWLMLAQDSTVRIDPSHIVTKVEATADVERSYLKATSSIALA